MPSNDPTGSMPIGGGKPSFDEFLRAHRLRLCRELRRRARYLSRHDAEDLAQEVFSRLCAAYGEIDSVPAALTYAQRIAENLITDNQRRHGRRDERWLRIVHDHQLRPPPDPADEIVRAHHVTAVRRAVRRLPGRQQHAITLSMLHEVPRAHVAEAMDVPDITVKALLQRGYAQLRDDLSDLRHR